MEKKFANMNLEEDKNSSKENPQDLEEQSEAKQEAESKIEVADPKAETSEEPSEDKFDFTYNTIDESETTSFLHVRVVPPKIGQRNPCVFICVVDVSGSMGLSGSAADSTAEDPGYSRLDLVKHSMKTIIQMLTENDYLSIVCFSKKATIEMEISKMDAAGKSTALSCIEQLHPANDTNLWDALRCGISNVIKHPVCKKLTTSILLFTDGEPNINPKEGILKSLKHLLGPNSPYFTMNTFGYGYKLNSELLYEISQLGNGINCYLPDCNLVGTTLVNCVCNTLATAANQVKISIQNAKEINLKSIGFPMKSFGHIDLGPIQYGQPRDFIFQFGKGKTKKKDLSINLEFNSLEGAKKLQARKVVNDQLFYKAISRCQLNELLIENLSKHVSGVGDLEFLKQIEKTITNYPTKDDEEMKGLLRDIKTTGDNEGRVAKAFSTPERIKRWGSHYVRSIIRAHQLQQCHNFKDPGVQYYGGETFKELRKIGDKIFCSLPPPTPSLKVAKVVAAAAAVPSVVPESAMQGFYDNSGGCFDGEGLVKMANGTLKKVKDLKKDDEVIDSMGGQSKVVCLVDFPVKRKMNIVTINKVLLTRTHPLIHKGVWTFPKDIAPVEEIYCEQIYNLVLDKNHIVNINGLDLVTLGHGKYDNDVVQHPYYGTEKVILDLQAIPGWSTGYVNMGKVKKYKDPFTKQVVAFAL